ADAVSDFGTRELPRIAGGQPIFGQLVLPAILQYLAENAVIVANAITISGDRQRRHAVHETGGEPSQSAVAERSIGLRFAQRLEIDTELAQCFARRCRQSQIVERVEEKTADQKLERQVVNAFAAVTVRC